MSTRTFEPGGNTSGAGGSAAARRRVATAGGRRLVIPHRVERGARGEIEADRRGVLIDEVVHVRFGEVQRAVEERRSSRSR